MSQTTLTIPESYAAHSASHWNTIKVADVSPSGVVILTLHRPHKHNAFTGEMMQNGIDAFDLFDVDDRVKCIIVTGGTGKIFCAGADLDEGLEAEPVSLVDARDGGGQLTLAITRCRKPSIAAMNGSAVGIGMTMTLPMNIRVASSAGKYGFVFARRGLIMEACSSFYLPRLIGYSKTMHLITTGATYPAQSPLLSDLFTEIVPPAQVLPRAIELAEEIAANCSLLSTYVMKELIYRNPGSAEGAHLLDSKGIHELIRGPDKEEGVNAFLEKRPVKFTGKVTQHMPPFVPWWQKPDVSVKNRGVMEGQKSKL